MYCVVCAVDASHLQEPLSHSLSMHTTTHNSSCLRLQTLSLHGRLVTRIPLCTPPQHAESRTHTTWTAANHECSFLPARCLPRCSQWDHCGVRIATVHRTGGTALQSTQRQRICMGVQSRVMLCICVSLFNWTRCPCWVLPHV